MSSRQACVVPLFDPGWAREVRRHRVANQIEVPIPEVQPSGPLLVLARHLQLEHLRSQCDGSMDERWAREVARELARLGECDWRRGSAVLLRVHTALRSELVRLVRLRPDRVWVSAQPWLEPGVPVILEHEDPETDCFVQISGHCVASTQIDACIAPAGRNSIIRTHRRRNGGPA